MKGRKIVIRNDYEKITRAYEGKMNSNKKISFDKNRKKAKTCPCGRNNRDGKFSPFKGYEDKGYCHSCGKSFMPEPKLIPPLTGTGLMRSMNSTNWYESQPQERGILSYLPFDIMEKSVMAHERCDLFPFLERLFTKPMAKRLCEDYFIGSNRHGNTVFWQVSKVGEIRQAKVMCYGLDGHRIEGKEWCAGKKILNNQFAILQKCFFGEYLLSLPENKSKPIAICEGEKTAVIASVYYPEFLWLATGGKSGINLTERETIKCLSGHDVILFPDLKVYDTWDEKAKLMALITGRKVVVSDILEMLADEPDKKEGLDIADYLLRVQDSSGLALTDHNYPVIWDCCL